LLIFSLFKKLIIYEIWITLPEIKNNSKMNINPKTISSNPDFTFVDNLAAPSCIINLQLNIVYANKSFSGLFNLSRGKSQNLLLKQFFRIDDIEKVLLDKLKKSQSGEQLFNFIALSKNAAQTDKVREMSLLAQRLKTPENHFLLTIHDAQLTNLALRPDVTEKHLFRLLLNELPDAIYFKDLQGRFFLTNRLHVKKLGLKSVDDFIGKTDFDLFTEEHARQAYNDEQEVILTGKSISKEEKETHHDGSVTYASTSKMPLKNEWGKVIGTFGISKDITAIKNAEIELLKARALLQEANDAKDKFFSILAHDLKNPFNSLIGLSDLLIEDYHDFSEKEIMEMLHRIRQTSEITYSLLENLLDWSRVQSGSITYNPEPVKLRELITDVIDLNQSHAYAKAIAVNYESDEEIFVNADKNMLRTIIRNLVSNAIKFTEKGGRVSVISSRNSENIIIIVEDTGIGMDSITLQQLFKISEKVKTYGTGEESGTGLGLIIAQEFVEKHQGTIAVQSIQGKGSKFTVSIPIQKP
jgi:two-component system, sensor histidine kinase and response regulator